MSAVSDSNKGQINNKFINMSVFERDMAKVFTFQKNSVR